MTNALQAEFRKIFTVRSTYGIFLFVLAFCVALTGFWIFGYKDVEHAALNQKALLSALYQVMSLSCIFFAFLALLSVGHEYRYNTILYGLTANNHRSRIYVTKWLALVITGLAALMVTIGLGYGVFYIGQHLHHIATLPQTMPGWDYVWHSAATLVGSLSLAYGIGMLVRSQILSIAVFLIMPTFIEGLLSILLKDNIKYLPFTAVGNLSMLHPPVPYTTSALVVAAYAVGLCALSWVLFLRRDAN